MINKIISLLALIWPYRIVRWVLSLTFLYAGITKLIDPEAFGIIIDAYGLLPGNLVMPAAIILPGLEVLAALGLFFDIRGSLSIISALLVLFLAILGYGIWMGLDIDCGCFAPEDPESRAYGGLRTAFYRDLVMVAGVIYMYVWRLFNSTKEECL